MTMTLGEATRFSSRAAAKSNPRLDAEVLMAHLLDKPRGFGGHTPVAIVRSTSNGRSGLATPGHASGGVNRPSRILKCMRVNRHVDSAARLRSIGQTVWRCHC